jgi:hypothetical protein
LIDETNAEVVALIESIRAFALARAAEGDATAIRGAFARVQRDLLTAARCRGRPKRARM